MNLPRTSGVGLVATPAVGLAQGPLATEYGEFEVYVLSDGIEQCMVAVRGEVYGQKQVLCRMHSECICSHVFFSVECDCAHQMRKALAAIAQAERGIVIFLFQEGRANGAAAHIATQNLKRRGVDQDSAYQKVGFPVDNRHYRLAAKAIRFLGIRSVCLLSASERKQRMLADAGVKVESLSGGFGELILLGQQARKLLRPPYVGIRREGSRAKIAIVGDISVDYTMNSTGSDSIVDLPTPVLGGTAVNAAERMRNVRLSPILIGSVGDDPDGRFALSEVQRLGITALVTRSKVKRTSVCHMIYDAKLQTRIMLKDEKNNANQYNRDDILQALELAALETGDFLLLISHFIPRLGIPKSVDLIEKLRAQGKGRLMIDLVPHNIYETVRPADFVKLFQRSHDFAIIAETATLGGLLCSDVGTKLPLILRAAKSSIGSRWLVLRDGVGNISRQLLFRESKRGYELVEQQETGYEHLGPVARKGFGDKLLAKVIEKYFIPDTGK